MMNKLEMAHQYFMQTMGFIRNNDIDHNFDDVVSESWDYVDAMQAKADKREKQKAIDDAESSKVLFEKLTGSRALQQTFIDGIEQPRYSDEQWQPDWSQAPDDCCFFCVASNGGYGFFTNLEPEFMGDYFYVGCGGLMIENHGYTGDWRNSLRKRP